MVGAATMAEAAVTAQRARPSKRKRSVPRRPTVRRAVKLGEFSIRVYHSVSSRKDTVTFILQARIGKEGFETFEQLYPHRKIKVRDQVIVATRLVPIEDYDDPDLKKFRRRIYLRLRRAIPELPIDDVYLSDFTLSVQST